MNAGERSVLDELRWEFYSMAVSIHVFRNERLPRDDRDGWLQKQLGFPSPEAYVTLGARCA